MYVEMDNYKNVDLYYYLLDVLKNEKAGAGSHGRKDIGRFKKILID